MARAVLLQKHLSGTVVILRCLIRITANSWLIARIDTELSRIFASSLRKLLSSEVHPLLVLSSWLPVSIILLRLPHSFG